MKLPVVPAVEGDCWNHIGVRGDRSCPELVQVGHCHNCPVFAAAGRRFLDGPSPEGYQEEWTRRLAAPVEETAGDLESVLIFRVTEEWLALPVRVLLEVTLVKRTHRIPHRGGLLAGLVNVRGELHLCVRLAQLLGIGETSAATHAAQPQNGAAENGGRLLVVKRENETWVFPVDQVEQVFRLPRQELSRVPATVGRAVSRLTRGVFSWDKKTVGLLDVDRLFAAVRGKIQ